MHHPIITTLKQGKELITDMRTYTNIQLYKFISNASIAVAAVTIAVYANQSFSKEKEVKQMSSNQKQQVVELLKSIETGDSKPVAYINPNKYIQHNLTVGDGLSGFGEVLAALPKGSAKVNTVRTFQDGDYVFTHTEYNFFGPKIGFDIFRYENGKIAEHWDNLQETPATPNLSGRSMIDGPVAVLDLQKTQANKQLVRKFVNDILVDGQLDKLQGYFNGDKYAQHNPQIGDGLSGLGAALAALAKAGISLKYNHIHKVLGEGNFVLVVSEGEFASKPTAFYDLFRVENSKIVEHWDTIETIPPKDTWQNTNGKFGFPE
jgi:predicted SnoaL-like aldol condensation-catalyzing enzyme